MLRREGCGSQGERRKLPDIRIEAKGVISGPRASLARAPRNRGRGAREQTRAESAQHLAERLWWQVARRDDSRGARRLYRTPVVAGVYQLDEGALLDDVCSCLQELGGGDWLGEGQGTAVPRERLPFVQYVLR